MDNWQKSLYERMKDFVGNNPNYVDGPEPVSVLIARQDAYVIMKALEVVEKNDNPMLVISSDGKTVSKLN